MGIFNSSGGGRFLGVACGALLVAVGFRFWEDRVSNPQRLRDISTEIIRHGGQCLDPEKGVVFLRDGVVDYSGIGSGDLSFRLWSQNGAVFGVQGQGDFSNGLGEIPLSPKEIPEFLSRAEAATRVLCTNTLSPSPNNTRPVGPSGSVALGFFEQGGRIS